MSASQGLLLRADLPTAPGAASSPEHFDVLIVGAGISGIGAAYHLGTRCPRRSYAILEARECIGGTWDLFRYPGIRSDSDMYTLGYSFRPWTEPKAIADGPAILAYLRETARACGIERSIRFRHAVRRAAWSSQSARWTVEVERGEAREGVRFTCNFLFVCAGYYDYEQGYAPAFPGAERFAGRIVHPQRWTEDVEWAGKRVVVIGSGATAVTLVPSLAEDAAHVTMLQRSPTYIVAMPDRDRIADALRRFLPARLAYALTRWKNVGMGILVYQLCQRRPERARRMLLRGVRRALGPGFDVERHFTPSYDPWDQRLCLDPNGAFFEAIRARRVSVVTDTIECFTQTGIRLASGAELPADLIVTATGLVMKFLGGLEVSVDGARVELPKTLAYKGTMLSGVPNLAMAVGYTNASWTLKCDLSGEYVCRLLNHMEARGFQQCRPELSDPSVTAEPLIGLRSGYVERARSLFPKQGSKRPWRLHQNYLLDRLTLGHGRVDDGVMRFSRAASAAETPEPVSGGPQARRAGEPTRSRHEV
jgi:cation diffusion facilitator CzcD-associated flavoprotein CzcO